MADKLELLVDIPESEKEAKKQQFEQVGFTVVLKQQDSGKWALAAAKCD